MNATTTYAIGTDREISVKRLYLTLVVKLPCPNCGEKVERDLSDDYLSYPVPDELFEFGLHCNSCKTEFNHLATLRLSLEVEDELNEITFEPGDRECARREHIMSQIREEAAREIRDPPEDPEHCGGCGRSTRRVSDGISGECICTSSI